MHCHLLFSERLPNDVRIPLHLFNCRLERLERLYVSYQWHINIVRTNDVNKFYICSTLAFVHTQLHLALVCWQMDPIIFQACFWRIFVCRPGFYVEISCFFDNEAYYIRSKYSTNVGKKTIEISFVCGSECVCVRRGKKIFAKYSRNRGIIPNLICTSTKKLWLSYNAWLLICHFNPMHRGTTCKNVHQTLLHFFPYTYRGAAHKPLSIRPNPTTKFGINPRKISIF